MAKKVAEIGFNPLIPLRDDHSVRNVYSRILYQRFDTRILDGYFKLKGSPSGFDGSKHVGTLIEYLISVADNSAEEAARRFWERFKFTSSRFPGLPKDLRPILGSYFKIKEKTTDLLMIKDLLETDEISKGVVADIGCGRNKLGRSILQFLDQNSIPCDAVVGTDINVYKSKSTDSRLKYEQQISDDKLPLKDESVDLAIIKWALHHMNDNHLTQILKEITRILRPGGRVAVIEALMGDKSELLPLLQDETKFPEMWPPGPWFQDRLQVTKEHLSLSLDQQRCILALEDYYGHWLEQRFIWMPLPFNYMDYSVLCKHFQNADMLEQETARRVYGMMPIIHWGPPTIRYVFLKR